MLDTVRILKEEIKNRYIDNEIKDIILRLNAEETLYKANIT